MILEQHNEYTQHNECTHYYAIFWTNMFIVYFSIIHTESTWTMRYRKERCCSLINLQTGCKCLPASGLLRSNIRSNFSLLPVSRKFPSWEKSTLFTMCLCAKECTSSPFTASHTFLKTGRQISNYNTQGFVLVINVSVKSSCVLTSK